MNRTEQSVYILLLVAGSLCLILPSYVPFNDLPQHAYMVYLLAEHYANNQVVTAHFEVNWLQPYTLTHALALILTIVWEPVTAIRLVLVAALVIFSVCGHRLISQLRGVEGSAVLSCILIPLFFNTALWYGFIPYVVGVATAVLFWERIVNALAAKSWPAVVHVVVTSVALFFSHIIACVCGLIGAVILLLASKVSTQKRLIVLASLLPVTITVVLWLWFSDGNLISGQTLSLSTQLSTPGLDESFISLFGSLMNVVPTHEHTPWILQLFAVWVLIPPFGLSRRPVCWTFFASFLLVFLLCPVSANSIVAPKDRLSILVFFALLPLLTIERHMEYARFLRFKVYLLSVVWMSAVIFRFWAFHQESKPFDCVTELIPQGTRIGRNSGYLYSKHIDGKQYSSFSSYAAIRTNGLTDWSFAAYLHSPIRQTDQLPEPSVRIRLDRNLVNTVPPCGEWSTQHLAESDQQT